MYDEIKALEDNNTWSIVPLPSGKHTIGCRWIYKTTFNPDGSIERHKARLVAKGYTQQLGVDSTDTFSPVAKLTTVRVLLAVAAQRHWHLAQLEVNNAFLNVDLFEEVYMDLPLGYPSKGEHQICKLHKSLYGLRHHQSNQDSGASLILLLVYVDDIIVACPSQDIINQTTFQLQKKFKLKVLGSLKYFLGLEISQSKEGIHLSQRKYTLELLDDT